MAGQIIHICQTEKTLVFVDQLSSSTTTKRSDFNFKIYAYASKSKHGIEVLNLVVWYQHITRILPRLSYWYSSMHNVPGTIYLYQIVL